MQYILTGLLFAALGTLMGVSLSRTEDIFKEILLIFICGGIVMLTSLKKLGEYLEGNEERANYVNNEEIRGPEDFLNW